MTNPLIVEEVASDDPLDSFVDEILGEAPEPLEAKPEPEEPTEETEEQIEEDAEPEYLEIRHNGKPVKMTLEDVLENASKGYDYTHKTQELAEQRRALEHQAQLIQQQAQFQQQFQQDIAQLTAMDMQLQKFQDVNWDNWMDADPVEASKGWQRYQMMQQRRTEMASTLQMRQAQQQQQMSEITTQKMAEAARELERDLGKAWNAETRAALVKAGVEFYGFEESELRAVQDPRVVKALYDAYKWRTMQAQKPAVAKKVSDAPKIAKPGKPVHDDGQRNQLKKMLKSSTVRSKREGAAMALLDGYV